jgi:hypothetical protein
MPLLQALYTTLDTWGFATFEIPGNGDMSALIPLEGILRFLDLEGSSTARTQRACIDRALQTNSSE